MCGLVATPLNVFCISKAWGFCECGWGPNLPERKIKGFLLEKGSLDVVFFLSGGQSENDSF